MPPSSSSPLISDFRQLLVWQKSMDFATELYSLTNSFPSHERFGLTSQLRRAAVSIPANIAEGNSRFSRGEYRQFVSYARGSTGEVYTELDLAGRLGYVRESEILGLLGTSEELKKMLGSLHYRLK